MFLKSRAGLLRPPLFESLNHEIGEGANRRRGEEEQILCFFAHSPTHPVSVSSFKKCPLTNLSNFLSNGI
jgi:hypothetical protein